MHAIGGFSGLEKTHFCPNCKSNNQIDYENYVHEDVVTETFFVYGYCHVCLKLSIFSYIIPQRESSTISSQVSVPNTPTRVELKSVYPISLPEISKDVSPDISKTYEEGIICLNSNAPNGAVAVFRRTLQKICIEKGAKQEEHLANQIYVLQKELQEEAYELKQWGNLGAHPDKIIKDVQIEDAQEMKGFLERVIYVMYELPAKLDRSKKNRDKPT